MFLSDSGTMVLMDLDWDRLAERIISRRVELGLKNREQLAAKAEISTRVIGDLEKARRENYDPVTLASIERALEWAAGSIRDVLAGREPTPADAGAVTATATLHGEGRRGIAQPASGQPLSLEEDLAIVIEEIRAEYEHDPRLRDEVIKIARDTYARQREQQEALRERHARELRTQMRTLLRFARRGPEPTS